MQSSTFCSSASDARLGYSSALPITSALSTCPSIWSSWAAPGVGVNWTVGPKGLVPIWSHVLPELDHRDVLRAQAFDVRRARIVDLLWFCCGRFQRAGLGFGRTPHADSEIATSPMAIASFAEDMDREGRG